MTEEPKQPRLHRCTDSTCVHEMIFICVDHFSENKREREESCEFRTTVNCKVVMWKVECVIIFDVEICLLMQVLQKLHTSPPPSLQVLIKYTTVFESLQVRFFTLCGLLTLDENMWLKFLLSTEVFYSCSSNNGKVIGSISRKCMKNNVCL